MKSRIAGLEEKFSVLNNEELADALHDRVVELESRTERWIPEALSLLLQLSDQPIQNSRLEDLEIFKPEPLPAPLTWADILADDPLDNRDGLWDDVDFAAPDSDEDADVVFDDPTRSEWTSDTEDIDDSDFDASQYELSTENYVLDPIHAKYQWKTQSSKDYSGKCITSVKVSSSVKLTEAQIKREAIFMLLGLPTPIYRQQSEGSLGLECCEIETEHMSRESLGHVLINFAKLSHSLAKNRTWIRRIETVALLQAFQAGLGSRMNIVERAFADIQSSILDPSCSSTTSLLDLFNEASLITRFTQQIAPILDHIQSVPEADMPLQLLERLYDRTCLNHSVGDIEGYLDMAQLFFDCFHVYLDPVRAWMEFGELGENEKTFFIRESNENVAPELLWEEQFHLIQCEAGMLKAPGFLHVAAKKIFTTGKSVNFLKKLGRFHRDQSSGALQGEKLDYEVVCKEKKDLLAPFSVLFHISLERWIADKHQSSSQKLREVLETQCGLKSSLDAIEIVYFNRNGALSGDIARVMFKRIDSGVEAWNDDFLLTDLFQGVLGAHPSIDTHRLAVRSVKGLSHNMQNKRRSVKVLDGIKVCYTLPWPVANIIKPESIDTYQRIFVILTQTQRAKNMIQRQHLMRRVLSISDNDDRIDRLEHSLRQHLLWFINTLLSYLTDSVLSVATQEMKVAITKAEDVDDMIEVHEKFISRLENQCLISKNLAPIHETVISILDLAILFSDAHTSHKAQVILTSHSITTNAGVRNKTHRRVKSEYAGSECSYDGDDENKIMPDLSYISFEETSYAERLKIMQASFKTSLSFVTAGLYGVHRAGGEPCWEILANSLAVGWGKRETIQYT